MRFVEFYGNFCTIKRHRNAIGVYPTAVGSFVVCYLAASAYKQIATIVENSTAIAIGGRVTGNRTASIHVHRALYAENSTAIEVHRVTGNGAASIHVHRAVAPGVNSTAISGRVAANGAIYDRQQSFLIDFDGYFIFGQEKSWAGLRNVFTSNCRYYKISPGLIIIANFCADVFEIHTLEKWVKD